MGPRRLGRAEQVAKLLPVLGHGWPAPLLEVMGPLGNGYPGGGKCGEGVKVAGGRGGGDGGSGVVVEIWEGHVQPHSRTPMKIPFYSRGLFITSPPDFTCRKSCGATCQYTITENSYVERKKKGR